MYHRVCCAPVSPSTLRIIILLVLISTPATVNRAVGKWKAIWQPKWMGNIHQIAEFFIIHSPHEPLPCEPIHLLRVCLPVLPSHTLLLNKSHNPHFRVRIRLIVIHWSTPPPQNPSSVPHHSSIHLFHLFYTVIISLERVVKVPLSQCT